MQDKINIITEVSSQTGLKVNRNKIKVLRNKTHQIELITLAGKSLEDVTSFTYLGSVVDQKGAQIRMWKLGSKKARVAIIMLKNIWSSKELRKDTKIKIFNSNIKAVLLYGSETVVLVKKDTNFHIQLFETNPKNFLAKNHQ